MAKKKKSSNNYKKPANINNDVTGALKLAEQYLLSNEETKITDTLIPFIKDMQSEEQSIVSRFNRLLIIGYANQQKFTQAEEIIKKSKEQGDESADYYFVMAFIHLSLREYDRVEECSDKYLNIIKDAVYPFVQYSVSENHQCQMHNFLGSAYMEQEDFDKAEKQFRIAIQRDPGNHLPYLNYINLLTWQNKTSQIDKVLKDGLRNSRQVQELRLLEESLKNKQTISACMMVKNEEELLPGCLESIRDWVDEIIIIDTGSTDKTVEIAKSYGAKIFHQTWEGNFSKHRNYSIEKASCDWIFIIDADERIVQNDINLIKQTIHRKDNQIISINVYNIYGDNNEMTTFLPSVRFWRRSLNLKYEGIVHNVLKLGMEHPVTRTAVKLEHLGYDLSKEKMTNKFNRTKELLEAQLEENPDNSFALYNYAQLIKTENGNYAYKNIPLIIKTASRAVALTDPANKLERHIHLMCLDQIAWAYFYDKDYDKSHEFCQKALKLKPDYLDPLILVAHIYANQQKWSEAEKAYHKYIEIMGKYNPTSEKDPMIITNIDNKVGAWYSLALIAENDKDLKKAKDYYHSILEIQKGYLESNNRLAKIYSKENNLSQAKKHYMDQLKYSNETVESIFGLAVVYHKENNLQEAETYYQKACNIDDFNPHIKISYSKFLLENLREKEGIEQLQKAIGLKPDSDDINQQAGDIYFNLRQYEKAIDAYGKITKSDSVKSHTLNNLANCYFKQNKFDKAEKYYLRAIENNNEDTMLYRNLGLAQAGLNNFEEAIITLEKYCRKNDDLPIISILGDLYLKLENHQKAMEYYEKYLAQNPHDFGTIYSISECYLLMGHRESAIIGYRRVIDIAPEFKPAYDRLNKLSEPVSKL